MEFDDRQGALSEILESVLARGEYETVLLSDDDGLILASAGEEENVGMMAAMTAFLRDSARQAQEQLGLDHVNELSLVGDDRFRLVCRFFATRAGQRLSLTLIVPPDRAYRRNTNRALRRIRRIWNV
jgi:predicted regulator of Ras-like GTPase activity (Roadblock/LC7/MglB family)